MTSSFNNLLERAQKELSSWTSLQAQGMDHLDIAINILVRRKAWASQECYGRLGVFPNLHQKVTNKQVLALERHIKALLNTLSQLEEVVGALEAVVKDAARLQNSECPKAGDAGSQSRVAFLSSGATRSAAELYEELEDIWRMLRDQLIVQHAIAKSLNYLSTEEELSRLAQCYKAQPGVCWPRIKDIGYWVLAKERGDSL